LAAKPAFNRVRSGSTTLTRCTLGAIASTKCHVGVVASTAIALSAGHRAWNAATPASVRGNRSSHTRVPSGITAHA